MGQNDIKKKRGGYRKKIDPAYLDMVSNEYKLGRGTYRQLGELYGIAASEICRYVKGKSEILQTTVVDMQNNNQPPMSVGNDEQIHNFLQTSLEAANQKIAALEILIQVAEEELGVKIRKKYGTKQ